MAGSFWTWVSNTITTTAQWLFYEVLPQFLAYAYSKIYVWVQLPPYEYTVILFERCLGLVNLIAFLSAFVQVQGLLGSNGLTPIRQTMAKRKALLMDKKKYTPGYAFFVCPTLFWFDVSDKWLSTHCWAGIAAAIAASVGIVPPVGIFFCWLFYHSLNVPAYPWFPFQWDTLLVEVNALYWMTALFSKTFAPWCLIWCLRLQIARVMLSSGLVKFGSRCETWKNLTALHYHYWTQPLPNAVAVIVHGLPDWFHKLSVGATACIQLLVPWLVYGPTAYVRFVCFGATTSMMFLIMMTGNYGFFNVLMLVMSTGIMEDPFWRLVLPDWLQVPTESNLGIQNWWWLPLSAWWIVTVLATIFFVTYVQCSLVPTLTKAHITPSKPFSHLIAFTTTFRLINSYGLFAHMTTFRKELQIEASQDDYHWFEYEFHHKPGNVQRPMPMCPGHLPRLDWRLWFIPLDPFFGIADPPDWYTSLLDNLVTGNPAVTSLLAYCPFNDKPPKAVRTLAYHYVFAHSAPKKHEPRRFGIPEPLPSHCTSKEAIVPPGESDWWYRELLRSYGKVVTFEQATERLRMQNVAADAFEPLRAEAVVAEWIGQFRQFHLIREFLYFPWVQGTRESWKSFKHLARLSIDLSAKELGKCVGVFS